MFSIALVRHRILSKSDVICWVLNDHLVSYCSSSWQQVCSSLHNYQIQKSKWGCDDIISLLSYCHIQYFVIIIHNHFILFWLFKAVLILIYDNIIVFKFLTILHDSFICLIKIMYPLCPNHMPPFQCGIASLLNWLYQCLGVSDWKFNNGLP